MRLKAHVIKSTLEEEWGRFSKHFSFYIAGILEEHNGLVMTQRYVKAVMNSYSIYTALSTVPLEPSCKPRRQVSNHPSPCSISCKKKKISQTCCFTSANAFYMSPCVPN